MKCVVLQVSKDDTPRYQHKHLDKELHIEKDGVSLVLNDVEIVQMLRALDAITKDSVDYFSIEKGYMYENSIHRS